MSVGGNGTAQRGLGGARGFGETEIARNDDGSVALDLSAVFESGLYFQGSRFDANRVFLNTNGTLSFGSAYGEYPTEQNTDPNRPLIAPFWGDVDTRLDGEGAESGAIWLDVDPAADVVTITWANVGVYRRNAELTNTVQLQLFDRGGGDFDIVFRYERIDWTQGTGEGDVGARAGLVGADPQWILPGEDPEQLTQLPDIAGNTGVAGLWVYEMRNGADSVQPGNGDNGANSLQGTNGNDSLNGFGGDDTIDGRAGDDTLIGGTGRDQLIGGGGDDLIFGGTSTNDLRDVVFGGAGNDTIDGGYGNDELRGDAGNDDIAGGFGADTVIGGAGDDTLTGSAFGDLIFGGDGFDFINGGFGSDRVNGGANGDRFFHLGVADHGSDWIQDYNATEGDVLVYGGSATRSQFQVNVTNTANAGGDGVDEAFIIYRPTGQILWALVDGDGQASINIRIGGQEFDLLA